MNTAPGEDELRIRRDLRSRIDGGASVPSASARPRDWLDDLWADEPPRPRVQADAPPPAPPAPPKAVRTDAEEPPRWDWRRLLHWPHARPAIGATAALAATVLPIPHVGYSAATIWAYCVGQIRADHGAGWGYAIGGGAFLLAAWLVTQRGRRAGVLRLTFLAITFVGLFGALSWFDPITFVTGVKK